MAKKLEDKDRHLAFSILDHFDQLVSSGKLSEDHVESLQVAMQCISEVFDVELTNEEHRDRYRLQPANLSFIFDMYLKTKDKYRASSEKASTSSSVKPVCFYMVCSYEGGTHMRGGDGDGLERCLGQQQGTSGKVQSAR